MQWVEYTCLAGAWVLIVLSWKTGQNALSLALAGLGLVIFAMFLQRRRQR